MENRKFQTETAIFQKEKMKLQTEITTEKNREEYIKQDNKREEASASFSQSQKDAFFSPEKPNPPRLKDKASVSLQSNFW